VLIPRDAALRPTVALPVRLVCHEWSSEHGGGEKMSLLTGHSPAHREGTGTRPDYLSDRADKKMEGPKFEQKRQENREIDA